MDGDYVHYKIIAEQIEKKLDQALVSKRMWEASCDAILIKRDEALKERDLAILERNKAVSDALKERDLAILERNRAIGKNEEILMELEAAIKQKQRFKDMMDKAYRERSEISRDMARLRREFIAASDKGRMRTKK